MFGNLIFTLFFFCCYYEELLRKGFWIHFNVWKSIDTNFIDLFVLFRWNMRRFCLCVIDFEFGFQMLKKKIFDFFLISNITDFGSFACIAKQHGFNSPTRANKWYFLVFSQVFLIINTLRSFHADCLGFCANFWPLLPQKWINFHWTTTTSK